MIRGRRRLFARASPVPIVLCIDVEPDDRELASGVATWNGVRGLVAREPATRDFLERVTRGPVALNWFLRADPQIEATCGDRRYVLDSWASHWDALEARGDEIGLHAHAWRAGDDGNPVVDHGDASWVEHCVASSLDAFCAERGAPPPSYRGGDRFLSDAVLDQVEGAGVAVDCTPEPGMPAVEGLAPDERTTGLIPDYSNAPLDPYRPTAGDMLRPARAGSGRSLTVVPLTPGAGATLAAWIEPDEFETGMQARLDRGEPAHLAFAIRSDLAQWDNAWDRMLANLETAVGALGRRGGRFVKASTLALAAAPVAAG